MATTTLTIVRAPSSQQANTLPVNISLGGTATLTTDYTLVSGTGTISALTSTGFVLTLAANTLSGTATLTTVPDTVYEADETVIFTLNPTPGVSSGTGSVTYTITNDDIEIQALTISLSSANGLEG